MIRSPLRNLASPSTPHSAYRTPHTALEAYSACRMPHSARERGQALLELAVFGSLMIFALGALVKFGLNADFSQQAAMASFRQALNSATEAPLDGKPTSVSHLHMSDRHIPNPANPFAIGSVSPTSAQAPSMTRNYQTQEAGTTVEELPRLTMDLKGAKCPGSVLSPAGSNPPCDYTTAGFRTERNVHPDSLDRYVEIYNRSAVCDRAECGGGDGECVRTEVDEQTGEERCVEFAKNLKIIDRCEGEIISLDGCIQQARQIVDSQVCAALCEKAKSPGSESNCQDVCNQPMNRPWYAQDAQLIDEANRRYDFPNLNRLFAGIRALGLQTGVVKATTIDASLGKEDCVRNLSTGQCVEEEEDEGKKRQTQTTNHVIWRDDTTRRVIRAVKPLDYTQDPDNPLTVTHTEKPEDSVTTTPKNEDSTTSWTTPLE